MKHRKHTTLPRPKNAVNAQKRRVERKRLRSQIVRVFADGLGVDIYYGDAGPHIITAAGDGVVEYQEEGQ